MLKRDFIYYYYYYYLLQSPLFKCHKNVQLVFTKKKKKVTSNWNSY